MENVRVSYYEKEDAILRETVEKLEDGMYQTKYEILNKSGGFEKYNGDVFNFITNAHRLTEEQVNQLKAGKQ